MTFELDIEVHVRSDNHVDVGALADRIRASIEEAVGESEGVDPMLPLVEIVTRQRR